MKIVGVSLGTRNGSNDAMCKEALIAAQAEGAEVSFIHLHDWDIQYCTGCVACSRSLVMGKGNVCTRKDEFDDFRNILLDADGILIVDPIFEKGASGLFHSLMDRFGPRIDRGMNTVAQKIAEENGGKEVDQRLLKDKVISFIGIGGSDWATAIEYDHKMLALSPAWKIIDNAKFAWSKNIIMEDEKVERVREIGRNLARAAADYDAAEWKGEQGICPHCHSKYFYFNDGDSANVTCMACGIEGQICVEDGKVKFVFTEEAETHAHDLLSGKFMHADDVKENETKAMANRHTEKYKASAERIQSFHIPEILPPSKRA
ncbi:MAG: flavodoxin family protein [Clostridiales bacterium]|nr:flavodoxin family protein [Clostridiales bacterium]